MDQAATAAVAAAADAVTALLDAVNHAVEMALLAVVPAAEGQDAVVLARAVYAASDDPGDLMVSLTAVEPARRWRDLVVEAAENDLVPSGWVSEGRGKPVLRPAIRAERIADAGRAAGTLADVIEAHLGAVRHAYEVEVDPGERFRGLWWRDLLLVTDTSATVLHLAFSD